MIVIITTPGHAYTVRSLLEGTFGFPTPLIRASTYEDVFRANRPAVPIGGDAAWRKDLPAHAVGDRERKAPVGEMLRRLIHPTAARAGRHDLRRMGVKLVAGESLHGRRSVGAIAKAQARQTGKCRVL